MKRGRMVVVGLTLGLCLAGCGAQSGGIAANTGGSGAGCTDWWTGAGSNANYSDPADWSRNRVPNGDDVACIRPGALVEINATPAQMPATLINEGTLCIEAGIVNLGTLDQGAPSGQAPFPPMPGVTTTPQCPTVPPGQARSQPANPAPSHPAPSPKARPSVHASLVD